eukprot:GHRQ01039023.1.p1 GENE.GHRQ01039023.1~~GHRQ01039023.1.p1  ORF type:complete len:247 (+),score=90.49 GHRQ01039023.1:183-923(+)
MCCMRPSPTTMPRQLDVLPASTSNPGIPPSSLMSFLRVKPSIQGVVLAEFDDGFINPYFGSRFDNGSTLNADGVAAVAAVLAAAVHRLAGGAVAALKVNMTELQQVAASYAACMVMPDPGFACPTAAAIMAPDYTINTGSGTRSYAPKHYVGVMQYMPDVQAPLGKNNLARFVWNAMALDGRNRTLGKACDHWKERCPDGQVGGCADCWAGLCCKRAVLCKRTSAVHKLELRTCGSSSFPRSNTWM